MGRTNRVDRVAQDPSGRKWCSMDSAPKDGSRVELWIPYTSDTEKTCADKGHWDAKAIWPYPPRAKGCWRFDGEDGCFDIQPIKWRPLAS